MRLAVRKSTTRSAAKIHVRTGGTTREAERASQHKGGVTSRFFASIDSGGSSGVTVSPTSVQGAATSSRSVPVTSRGATINVTGGVPPYTYAWTQASGDAMTATDPSSASTLFQATVAPGGQAFGVWTGTATDAAGVSGSAQVNVALNNLGGTL